MAKIVVKQGLSDPSVLSYPYFENVHSFSPQICRSSVWRGRNCVSFFYLHPPGKNKRIRKMKCIASLYFAPSQCNTRHVKVIVVFSSFFPSSSARPQLLHKHVFYTVNIGMIITFKPKSIKLYDVEKTFKTKEYERTLRQQ